MEHNTRIYVANLRNLHGDWIDMPFSEEEWEDLLVRIGVMDEDLEFVADWEIHDTESDIENLSFDDIETLNDTLMDFEALRDYEQELVDAIMEYENDGDLGSAINNRNDYILYGDVEDEEDYGRMYVESMGELPSWVENYFDFKSFGEDLIRDISGDFTNYGFLERTW